MALDPRRLGSPTARAGHAAGPRGSTQGLWMLSHTLPWLGDLSTVPGYRLERTLLEAQARPFDSADSAVSWIERSLGLTAVPSRRMPSSRATQREVLDRLGVHPSAYDFYASYLVQGRELYVFTHDEAISGACLANRRIEASLRHHHHRTGRIPMRTRPERLLATKLGKGIAPTLDLVGIDPLAARSYLAVGAIKPGQVRSLDWVVRSVNCPGADSRTVLGHLADNPFPYVVSTYRVFGPDGWPVLGGLGLEDVENLYRRERLGEIRDLLDRGARYVARPASAEYCELSCPRARLGERGAFLISDPRDICEVLSPCALCRPTDITAWVRVSRSA